MTRTEGAEDSGLLLEREIQHFLSRNLGLICPYPLQLVGLEYPLTFGRIDILAKTEDGGFVVIEVKRGTASRGAVGQLLSYIGAVAAGNPGATVRGILVAGDLDEGAQAALNATRGLWFCKYSVLFDFSIDSSFGQHIANLPPAVASNLKEYWRQMGGVISPFSAHCARCKCRREQVRLESKTVCAYCGHLV